MCQSLVEAGRAGLSQTPSAAIGATSSTCRNKCAHWRRAIAVQESTAVDGGINDTGKHTGCIVSFKGIIRIVSVALRALTLAHCVG